jgi:penicillin-binding protein 2
MIWTTRRFVLLSVLGLSFLALAGRLAYMQLIQVDYYRSIANDNRIRMVPITAPRGRILDRNGAPLVVNRPAFTVSVVPADFRGDRPRARLADALQISSDELNERLRRQTVLPLEPVIVNRDADLRLVSRIEERIEDVSGVMISTDPVREYPTAAWAGHLLGYTRAVSERDQQKKDKSGATLRGDIGAAGLERWYDDLLRGVDGVGYRQINAYGQALGSMPGYPDIAPIPGDDLRLTIDVRLQQLADSLLTEFVAGTIVAMELKSGAIVCLETRPGFESLRGRDVVDGVEHSAR